MCIELSPDPFSLPDRVSLHIPSYPRVYHLLVSATKYKHIRNLTSELILSQDFSWFNFNTNWLSAL